MILIIWFICWRGLPGGDDPLDPYALSHEQLCHDLLVRASGNVMEKIDNGTALQASSGLTHSGHARAAFAA